jgi:fatty-acid desaturase
VCFRVWVGITGHWLIGHFAHRHGHRAWDVQRAAVQGFNVRVPGLGALGWWITGAVSFGECWHNNHHAFPASSRIGHARHELDPAWWVLLALHRIGLVGHLALPADLPHRSELRPRASTSPRQLARRCVNGPCER